VSLWLGKPQACCETGVRVCSRPYSRGVAERIGTGAQTGDTTPGVVGTRLISVNGENLASGLAAQLREVVMKEIERHGVTPAELALALGLSEADVESSLAERHWSLDTALRLSEPLGISLSLTAQVPQTIELSSPRPPLIPINDFLDAFLRSEPGSIRLTPNSDGD
jgi:plasmid maintenance system antidote protein VapI